MGNRQLRFWEQMGYQQAMEGDWRAVTGNTTQHRGEFWVFTIRCLFTSLSQLSWPQLGYKDGDAWTNYPEWSNKKNWTLKRSESLSISRPADGFSSCRFRCSGHHPLSLSNLSWRTIATQLKNNDRTRRSRKRQVLAHECFSYFSMLCQPVNHCQPDCQHPFLMFMKIYENLIKFDQALRTLSDFDPGTVAALKELIHQRSKFPLEQMVLLLGCRTGGVGDWSNDVQLVWISCTGTYVCIGHGGWCSISNKVWISSCTSWSIKSECNTSFFLQQHSHVQAKRLGEDSAGKSNLFWMQALASLNQMTSCNSCI